ncbi:hypothetical protein [Vibrio harveyi]|uniref:hypothetical protein n=1 Tax=Vibrio harveyi TaxID=669 RepID=UPI003CE6BCC6
MIKSKIDQFIVKTEAEPHEKVKSLFSDTKRLHELNQYKNTHRTPTTAQDWVEHYEFLSKVSNVPIDVIMQKVKYLSNVKMQHHRLLNNDPKNQLQEFETKKSEIFKSASNYFIKLFGFDLTTDIKNYDMNIVWNSLLNKYGKTKVVKRLYADQVIKVFNEIHKDRAHINAYHAELDAIGVNYDTVIALLKSWNITDAKQSAKAYKEAYIQLESELVMYHNKMYSIETDDTLNRVKIEHVVDRLIKSHRFDKTDENFNKYLFNYQADIMLIKLCFSQAINKARNSQK